MRSPVVLLCHVQSSTARLCPCVPLRARIVADAAETTRISASTFVTGRAGLLFANLWLTSLISLGTRNFAMARVLTWVSDKQLTGWACSACDLTFPLPSLAMLRQRRLTTDSLRPSFKDMIVL